MGVEGVEVEAGRGTVTEIVLCSDETNVETLSWFVPAVKDVS